MIGIASPDASILPNSSRSVGHPASASESPSVFVFGSNLISVSLPAPQIQTCPVPDRTFIAYGMSLPCRKRIDFPLIVLWNRNCRVAAAIARYPTRLHRPLPRAVSDRRPAASTHDLAVAGHHSYSLPFSFVYQTLPSGAIVTYGVIPPVSPIVGTSTPARVWTVDSV